MRPDKAKEGVETDVTTRILTQALVAAADDLAWLALVAAEGHGEVPLAVLWYAQAARARVRLALAAEEPAAVPDGGGKHETRR
jgi:hypothetical protein